MKKGAFTLIELLIVLVITGIVLALAVPVVSSSLRGMQLTQTSQMVDSAIRLARQIALTKNRTVEVRFYRYTSAESGGVNSFQAFQSFEIDDSGSAKALSKARKLPATILFDASPQMSSLFSPSLAKAWTSSDPAISIPGTGTTYNAYAFQFRPDGSANLAINAQWYVTLHYRVHGDNLATLPHNFTVLNIDPWNGQTHVFRP
ncbi:MAG: Verru_Chthon cassette protein D [Chthoniobacteraceae bacterium]